jgi:hypothetical protein
MGGYPSSSILYETWNTPHFKPRSKLSLQDQNLSYVIEETETNSVVAIIEILVATYIQFNMCREYLHFKPSTPQVKSVQ